MKKKILSVCNVVLAVVMLLSTACQKGGGEESNGSDWLSESEVVSEDSTPEESSSSDSTSEEEEENPNLPEYEPDPVPTEPIEIQATKIVPISGGYLAIDGEGKLWFGGSPQNGNPENGKTIVGSNPPQAILTDVRFSSLAEGSTNVLAIDTEGNLWGWGKYDTAEEGGVQTVSAFTRTFEGRKFVQAATGYGSVHCYAIDTEGNLWGWGKNKNGCYLGDGTEEYRDTPVQIMPGTKFSYVSSGYLSGYAIDVDGNLWGWGQADLLSDSSLSLGDGSTFESLVPVQIMPGSKFVQVSTYLGVHYAIDTEGRLWGWGSNRYGYLGDGTKKNRSTPVQIMKGKYFTWVDNHRNGNVFAIDVQGKLWVWGDRNSSGQLGTGDEKTYKYPVQIAEETTFQQALGGENGLGLDENGEVLIWGTNEVGQIDWQARNKISQPLPVCIMEEKEFVKVVAEPSVTFAIDTEDTLWEWRAEMSTYQQAAPGMKIKEIAAGDSHYLAIDTEGQLWTWGTNDAGLGNGVTTSSDVPIQIIKGKQFAQVAAGGTFSLALDTEGSLWSWGKSDCGALGLGSNIKSTKTPMQVKSDTKFVQITAGYDHAYAIDEDGNLWGWGGDEEGNLLGLSEYSKWGSKTIPTQMQIESSDSITGLPGDLVNFSFVSTRPGRKIGNFGTGYAIDSDGNLWVWGGTDSMPGGLTPSRIFKNKTFSIFATGHLQVLAIDTEGRLWTWGYNRYGEVGNGTIGEAVSVATEIMPKKRFSCVAARGYSSYAIDTDGKLWAWGINEYGEIIPNFPCYYNTPQRILLNNEEE